MSEELLHRQTYEQVVQRVAPGSRLRRLWPLQGGISANMVALEIETAVGLIERMVIRQYRDDHLLQYPGTAADEYRLLQLTQKQDLATPAAIYIDQSCAIIARPYLVLAYVEGEMDFSPQDLAGVMRQMAAQLVKIHRVDPLRIGLSFLPGKGKRCLESNRERLFEVDPRSLEGRISGRLVAAGLPAKGNAAALLHGDFWPGNTLWRDGKLAAVIDWEDAALGDPLMDLANSRAEIAWIFGIDAAKLFTREYQSQMDLDYGNLAYWDTCAALRVLRIAGGDLAGLASYFASYGRADINAESIEKNLLLLLE